MVVRFIVALAVLCSVVLASVQAINGDDTTSWKLQDPIKMPGELRLASEGLTHDKDGYIYLNSKRELWKCELGSNKELAIVSKNTAIIPKELQEKGYNHVGDIDLADGIIYAGFEWSASSPGVLASINSTTLEVINYKVTDQEGMPWVAYSQGKLFSTAWDDTEKLNVYSADDFSLIGTVEPSQGHKLPQEIQGAAFWSSDEDAIYLAVNGPDVFRFSLTEPRDVVQVLVDMEYKHHVYEMEGITFFDLENTGCGTLHVYGNYETLLEKSIHNFSPLKV
jgi:hypothetical protein